MVPLPPTYTDSQVEAYLKRIRYVPSAKNSESLIQDVRQRIEADALGTLGNLQRRHLASIPWGNSGLHYSQHHTITLNPDQLFEKIVERRLDGYCMEMNGIFSIILRSLGYFVYATGGRVSFATATGVDNGQYLPLGHMVLMVILNGEKYMVDVGFGNQNATAPLPLRDGATAACIAPSEMRLVKESIPEFVDQSQKIWIYQTRYNPESKWLPHICFSETEFLPQDFDVMNFTVSQKRTSWFTQIFVCTRMTLDPSGQEIIGQDIISGKEVKRRVHGITEILKVLHNEEDRVTALAKYFDMHFRESEIQGIQGLSSELK
ncbi:Arylamine N-acetyltransferase [Penicillium macrosclerotiorum]|uniref:Arylamine N-acetyltransferase n=1 Tax=Penicillium macrosclerotiorum TaxID=303699 RepID=UPI0025466711|nr:Arylamine N-acetyltransferase [Penicillium macrosclerotiorum]KAJ5662781.1 Arylamine N-acetyltransferase [Penicillium macrosclerotiorum]